MGALHEEVTFEDEVCASLSSAGWLYVFDDGTRYDRARALFVDDLAAWVAASRPSAWNELVTHFGSEAAAAEKLADRLVVERGKRGTLDVLRHGMSLYPAKGTLPLAQFRPAMGINPEIVKLYDANRLRVVRQVRYSLANEKCLDLVLFLNGLPVATVELKTDFTQSVADAVDQYRRDRQPQPKGQAAEPLLAFATGALVHFAVSTTEVMMTTRLNGAKTVFLPFNKGRDGGAGNPPSPVGYSTAYLWDEVWERNGWLEILGRYVVAEKDEKGAITKIVFPRYHQLDATRKLLAAVLKEGVGGKYLIQHSAGSGKTNSIAWSAHFLSELHDEQDEKLFSTVLVVSDRNVIDAQLRDTLFQFERTQGVVETISNDSGAKSGQLAQALAAGKKVVVCTIQTFPFALQQVRDLAASHGKRFAVIADEAHSSQTGEAATKLKEVLSAEEIKSLEDGGEYDTEDLLALQMTARAKPDGVTYVAFTATPKAKTLQLFGRRPRPDLPESKDNLPEAFHVYSMRQAIEEGFILDVLQNYTPYDLVFRLAQKGADPDDKAVDRSTANRAMMQFVQLHPHNIAKKVEIVVEHYRSTVQPLLDGKAKAMIVLASRKEAVRWKLAVDRYIAEKKYPLGTLVAFSGEVTDPDSSPEPLSETSKLLNPTLKGDIRDSFKHPEHHLLLVANKFQTGFDQPLLCGMYVDRRLAGIQAVQTLSRLNRAYDGKDTTYVLDFANAAEEIVAAFQQYFETARPADVTDPNVMFDLRQKLDASGHYDNFQVERVAAIVLNPKSKQADLAGALTPVADRLLKLYSAAKKDKEVAVANGDEKAAKAAKEQMDRLHLFKGDLGTFVRLYAFLSQVFDYGDTDLEKRWIFYKHLVRLLDFGRERDEVDLSDVVLTHVGHRNRGQKTLPLAPGAAEGLSPVTEAGSGSVQEKQKALLREIIERMNDLFGADTTDGDKVSWMESIKTKLLESDALVEQAVNNTKSQVSASPTLSVELDNAIVDALDAYKSLSSKALASPNVRRELLDLLLGPGQLYEALRERAAVEPA